MGLETLDEKQQKEEEEQKELGDDWMVVPVDLGVLVIKQTEFTVKKNELDEFKETIEEELSMFEGWVRGQVFNHPDVFTEEHTDPEEIIKEYTGDEKT